jgi:hypothetical protein
MIPRWDLGLPDVGAGDRDPVVTSHRDLEAAAERVTVQGGNQGLAGVFQCSQTRVAAPAIARAPGSRVFSCCEHVDVRAGDERRARADQDDRVALDPAGRSTPR